MLFVMLLTGCQPAQPPAPLLSEAPFKPYSGDVYTRCGRFIDDIADGPLHDQLVIIRAGRFERTNTALVDAPPFPEQSFDAIWSEDAIDSIGFATGVKAWRRFLERGGILAVPELTWLTQARPAELEEHWIREYAGVDTASAKLAIREANGFSTVGYFAAPKQCWLDNYYGPMQAPLRGFPGTQRRL